MTMAKIIPAVQEQYERRFPQQEFYTEFCIEEIADKLPLTVYRFRGLALKRGSDELYFTSAYFESDKEDDVIPPSIHIANNTIRIKKEDAEYIANSALNLR